MTADLRLRPAGPFDLPVLAVLHQASFTAPWDQAWTADSFADILAMPGAAGLILLGPAEEPLGFAVTRSVLDETEIILLAVRPDYRGRGLGRILTDGIIAMARASGQQAIFLEHAAPNSAAARLYRAAGFKQIGARRNYYKDANNIGIDAVTMRLDLSDAQ